MRSLHILSLAGLLASAATAQAQSQSFSVNFAGDEPKGAQPAAAVADGADTVKVVAKGVGTTREEALKDAYRDAVERAVGLYVDAESIVENDQLVQNEVLTLSNAYIKECRELGEPKQLAGGLVQVRIVAVVQKQKLTAKLKDVMPTQNVAVSLDTTQYQSMVAERATTEKRSGEAKALVDKLLDELDPIPQLMVASVDTKTMRTYVKGKYQAGEQTMESLPPGKVAVGLMLSLKVDEKKYFEQFVPRVKAVFDRISLCKPSAVRLTPIPANQEELAMLTEYLARNDKTEDGGVAVKQRKYARKAAFASRSRLFPDALNALPPRYGLRCDLHGNNSIFGSTDPSFLPGCKTMGVGAYSKDKNSRNNCFKVWNGHGASQYDFPNSLKDLAALRGKRGLYDSPFEGVQTYNLTLLTSVNSSRSMWKGETYQLDPEVGYSLYRWIFRRGAVQYRDPNPYTHITYNIVFENGGGEELFVYEWKVPRLLLMNVDVNDYEVSDNYKFGNEKSRQSHVMRFYATPFVGCAAQRLIQWRDVLIDEVILREVKNIKIELAQ